MMRDAVPTMDAGQFGEFVEAVVRQLWPTIKDADPQRIRRLVRNPAKLKGILRKAFPGEPSSILGCPVIVDYEVTVEEAIRLGGYDRVNSFITSKNFPTGRRGIVELDIDLMCINRLISTRDFFKEIGEVYRQAELRELLALGAKYPNLQREFPIAGLGSVWQSKSGHHRVSVLDGSDSERGLDLETLDESVWQRYWQFAVVRK
ncbi:MAG: hypothetical protein Q7S82_01270 [bacterium]|nr:hypothetical protein [bacterium]